MTLRRLLLYTLGFLAALVVGTWLAVTRAGVGRAFVLGEIGKLIRARHHLGEADIAPFEGKVRLGDLRLTAKPREGPGRRETLHVPRLTIGVSMNPLSSPGEVRTIEIEGPELDVWLGDPTPLDLAELLHLEGDGSGRLPSLRIKDLVVRLHLPGDRGPTLRLGPIQLLVRPDAESLTHVVVEGECPNPLGGTIRIRGSGDTAGKQLRLLAEAQAFDLDETAVRALSPEAARFVAERGLRGKVKPTLWLSYPDAKGALAGGLRAEFHRLSIVPPTFTYRFTDLEGVASATTERGGTLEVRIDRAGRDLDLSGSFRLGNLSQPLPELELQAQARNVQITPELLEALAGIEPARRVCEALRPTAGRADLRLHVHAALPPETAADPGIPRTQLDLDVREADLCFEGMTTPSGTRLTFPYPLTGISGRVEVRDDHIVVRGVRGKGVHGGDIEADGELDFAASDFEVKARAKGLPLEPPLQQAIAAATPEGGRLFAGLQPTGKLDAEASLRAGPDGEPSLDLVLRPQAASAAWPDFPYRVDNVVGEIRIVPDEVALHVAGNRGVAQIETRARFRALGDPGRESMELWVKAQRGRLDADLRRALAHLNPVFDDQWALFQPEGEFDVDFLAWRAPGNRDLAYDIRADLRDADALFQHFRAPLHEIRGPVVLHGDRDHTRVEVVGISGRGLDAHLLFHGSLDFAAAGALPVTDLTVVAKGVHLNDDLAHVLVREKIVTRELWDLSRVSGSVDAILRIRRAEQDPGFRQDLLVDMRQLESAAEILPGRLTRLSGLVRIDADHVITLDDVTGYVDDSKVRCETGSIREVETERGGETVIDLVLSAERYPVDSRLANLLEGDIKRAYLERNAKGEVTVARTGMTLHIPKVRPAKGLGVSGEFRDTEVLAHDVAMDLGVRVTGIGGRLLVDRGSFDATGSRVDGRLAGLDFQVLGQVFRDGRGPFQATNERFTLPEGEVVLAGGRLRRGRAGDTTTKPLVDYSFAGRRHLETNLEIDAVNLERLLVDLQTSQPYRGLISGQVTLGLDIDDPTTLAFDASLGVGEGWLGDAPLFRSIYALLQPEKRPIFDSGLLEATGRNGVIDIRRLMLRSPIMRLEGKGTFGYDGYLALVVDFPDLFPEASNLTILPGLYRLVAGSLVKYDVTGYIGDLRTGPRFRPLEGKPERGMVAPVPGNAAPPRSAFR